MDWKITIEILGIIGGITTVFALFLAPMFWLGSKIDAFRVEVQQNMDAFRAEVHQDMNEFRKEMKDFHGRLSIIEERKRK